jgi:hypothetical protein
MSETTQIYAHYLSTCEKQTIRYFIFFPSIRQRVKKATPDEEIRLNLRLFLICKHIPILVEVGRK